MYLEPFSLLLGEAKVGKVLLEGAEIAVERNEVGDANLEMLPPPDGSGPHAGENRSLRIRANPAFPWINTIEVREFGADHFRRRRPAAGRAQCGARQLQVDRAQSAAADRREPQRAAGDAARADRDDGFVRRLDAGLAGQHRCAGRLRRRQDRDQGQHRHQGHRSAGHERGPGCRGLRSLCPPAAAERRSLCAEREGRDPAQRPQGRGAVAQGRGVRADAARRCFAPIAAARRSSRSISTPPGSISAACARRPRRRRPRHAAAATSPAADHAAPGKLARTRDDLGDGARRRDDRAFGQDQQRFADPVLLARSASPSVAPPRSAAARRVSTSSTIPPAAPDRRR